MSDYLPPEIVRDILPRLPVAAILRCTAVCKSWYSLITSSSFISSHLKICNNQNPLFVKFCTQNEYDCDWDPIVEHFCIQSIDKIEKLECPVTSWNLYEGFTIIGSFNGLYCLYDEDTESEMKRIILWNPSLRKSLTLPDSRVICKSIYISHAIGFGFLPETNEYKIVKAVSRYKSKDSVAPPKSEIFNLSSGNWTDVDDSDYTYIINDHASQAFLNGSIHWDAYRFDHGEAIVSINLKTEKFDIFMIPDACHSDRKVSTFKDFLCVMQNPSQIDNFWTIWVMYEYGVESSWVKQYRINTLQFDHTYSGFGLLTSKVSSDTLLAVGFSDGDERRKLVSFDPNSKEVTNLGEWEQAQSLYVDTYMESLIWIKVPNDATSRVMTESDSQILDEGEIEVKFSKMYAT